MDLTRRQKNTLKQLLELYQDLQEPLHYSVLAEKLGVSKFTAYDMLRLLEEKGYVRSTFRLDRERGGPGRSEVVYMPTEKANRDFAELARVSKLGNHERDKAIENIMAQFYSGELPESDFVNDILARIPGEENERLRYCMEIMMVIALRMKKSAHGNLAREYISVILPEWKPANLEDLALVGGVALGILVIENQDNPEWCQQMFEHIYRYKSMLVTFTVEEHRQLGEMIAEVFSHFQTSGQEKGVV